MVAGMAIFHSLKVYPVLEGSEGSVKLLKSDPTECAVDCNTALLKSKKVTVFKLVMFKTTVSS